MLTSAWYGQIPLKLMVSKARKSLGSFGAETRLLLVPKRYTWIKSGMVISTKANGQYLLGKHHDSVQYYGFYGLGINQQVTAIQTVEKDHPITGMPGHREELPPQVLPMVEYNVGLDDAFGLPVGKLFLISGTPVNRDWKLNGYRVAAITKKLGLTFIEVEAQFD